MGDSIPSDAGTNAQSFLDTAEGAQMLLRAKNIKEYHSVLSTAGSLTFPNGIAIDSGVVVQFKNKGMFDGKWIIQKVTLHLVDGKLVVEIEFRKCLIFPGPGTNVKFIYNTQVPPVGAEPVD
jgi:hypothetical protein